MPILHGGKGKVLHLRKAPYLWQRVAGLPTPLAWWQPKSDSYGSWVPTTIAESYTNVANPGTYNAAPGTAPAWAAATGWTFTAASLQFLTTGVVPATGYSMLVCFSGVSGATTALAGCQGLAADTRFNIWPNNGAANVRYGYGTGTNYAPPLLAGTLCLCPGAGYRGGVSDGAIGAVTLPLQPIGIGCYINGLGSPASYITAVETLVAVWDSDISAYIASLYTVLQAAGLTT